MPNLPRRIEPEWLDTLPPADPRARRARRDLRRLNAIMGNAGMLQRCWRQSLPPRGPLVVAELGAGDGTFLLALARRLAPHTGSVRALLVDRQPCVSEPTWQALRQLGWTAECVTADALAWSATADAAIDVTLCNLFLHHLPQPALATLFAGCATRTSLFLACEPARTRLALCASHLLGVIGCNAVTRHDAVASVHAGFRRQELSALWPDHPRWLLEERRAGLFSHVFVARRRERDAQL